MEKIAMRTLTKDELELVAGGLDTIVVNGPGGSGDGGGNGGWGGGAEGGSGGGGGGGSGSGSGSGGDSPAHGDAPPVDANFTFHASDNAQSPGVNHGNWTLSAGDWAFSGAMDITDAGHINTLSANASLTTPNGTFVFSSSSPGTGFVPSVVGGYDWDLGNGLQLHFDAGFNTGNDEVSAHLQVKYTF
ncbi:hypothetical protein C8J98_102645 [Luteibacter sp. OK325]|nr:hypothetical protein C8J98_102645 [Luteibacter sp. OK325]